MQPYAELLARRVLATRRIGVPTPTGRQNPSAQVGLRDCNVVKCVLCATACRQRSVCVPFRMSVFEEIQLRKQNTALALEVEELHKQLEAAEAKLRTAGGGNVLDELRRLDAELQEANVQIAAEELRKKQALQGVIHRVDKKKLKDLIARLS